MVKDDLWANPEDEFTDAEETSELVKQTANNSFSEAAIAMSSRTILKKMVLKKVAESSTSIRHLSGQFEHNPQLPAHCIKNAESNQLFEITTSYGQSLTSESPVASKALSSTSITLEDLWSDSSEEPNIDEPSTVREEAPVPGQYISSPTIETDSELEIEDDLWVSSDDFLALDENEELVEEWSDNEQIFPEEDKHGPFDGPPLLDSASSTDLFADFQNVSRLQDSENAAESGFLLDGFEFIDIKAELAELEQIEEEIDPQQPETDLRVGIDSGRGRVRASGWMRSSSVLYIDWEDEERAEQEALERLGYSKLKISEATRAFVIQAACACKLTLRQERLLTNQLADARSQLAQLPNEEDFENRRNELKAEIAEIERTLVYNLQWVAVKKAPHFLGQGVDLDDLIQYGMLGIIAGIRHFDVSRNSRLLVAVNWWVFQALARAVAGYERHIRLPVYVHESLANIKKQRTELEKILGRLPTNEELASAVQMPVKRLEELLSLPTTISLDSCIKLEHANDGYSFQPRQEYLMISDEDCLSVSINEDIIRQDINTILSYLTPREREVIWLRYDLGNDGCMRTLEEVGKEMHVTRERIRQIEERAFRKMRLKLGIQEKPRPGQNVLKRVK